MRVRAFAATVLLGLTTVAGGVAAGDGPTTVYFQMQGACADDPPHTLSTEQREEYSGPCFPVQAGTIGPAYVSTEEYLGDSDDYGITVAAGAPIAGQFAFTSFAGTATGNEFSAGQISLEIVITATMVGKDVTVVEFSEAFHPVIPGSPTVFEFTGEFPEGGRLNNLNATVTANGNTVLGMGFDHANSFFTIG